MILPFQPPADYRFCGGTLRELMDIAGKERLATSRVTCKCCGRPMLPVRQSFETLYTCSEMCNQHIAHSLIQDYEFVERASYPVLYS